MNVKILHNYRSIEFYIFYITLIYFLVAVYFLYSKMAKIVNIVLTGPYLFEYSVAWCILGDSNCRKNDRHFLYNFW